LSSHLITKVGHCYSFTNKFIHKQAHFISNLHVSIELLLFRQYIIHLTNKNQENKNHMLIDDRTTKELTLIAN